MIADERAVLITGAAGAIGRATVGAFLGKGLRVVGLDRAPAELRHERYRHVVVDLTHDMDVEQAVADGLEDRPLAHLIGIAGGAMPAEPALAEDPGAIEIETFRASIEANLTSQFIVLRACLSRFGDPSSDDRSVSFTSSFNALSAQGMPAYSAAKSGLIGLMYGLVGPLGSRAIRVNVVAPGTVRTPRVDALWAGVPGHFEELQAGTALGRLATASDIADTFVALALELRHVTGQVLTVDGGQSVIHGTRG